MASSTRKSAASASGVPTSASRRRSARRRIEFCSCRTSKPNWMPHAAPACAPRKCAARRSAAARTRRARASRISMRSGSERPSMRTGLTVLLAFVLGLALAWFGSRSIAPPVAHVVPNVAAPQSAKSVPSTSPRKPLLDAESPPSLLPDQGWPRNAPTPEQVVYAQPDLMDKAAAQLKPRTPGKVNLHAIAFAGDGSENVFRNEAEYFEKLFSQRFGAAGHVLVLENNPASLTTRPLADWSNLESALD